MPLNPTRTRLDKLIFNKGLAESRSKAAELITQGKVTVEGKIDRKPSTLYPSDSTITIESPLKFVSRSGQKLDFALESFKLDITGMTALDIGASTGGFSDCLLQRKAHSVLAVDVGTDQLHPKIRENPKIINMERTDFRSLKTLPINIDLVVIDVSFISVLLILSHLQSLNPPLGLHIIALIKPQFEGQRINLNKKGVVRDKETLVKLLKKTLSAMRELGFRIHQLIESPITGGEGNREFLVYLRQNPKNGNGEEREEFNLDRFFFELDSP